MLVNETARALLGLVVFLVLGWLLSENKRALPWRAVLVGLSCQIGLALLAAAGHFVFKSLGREAAFGLT